MKIDWQNLRTQALGSEYHQWRGRYRLESIRAHGFRWVQCKSCGRDYQCANGSRWYSVRRKGKIGRCMPCESAARLVKLVTQNTVAKAIQTGMLRSAVGQQCVDCGVAAEVLDHRDYEKPLDVDPVCKSCNSRRGAAEPFRTRLRVSSHASITPDADFSFPTVAHKAK